MKIEVFTDGSATIATKPGGYAYVLVINGQKHAECAGHAEGASNNDMELEAAIQGLAAALKFTLNNKCKNLDCRMGRVLQDTDDPLVKIDAKCDLCPKYEVILCSDSQLVLGWADGSYKFKQAAKMDKYRVLQRLVKTMNVKTQWIRGHSGHEHNERCDKLANEARTGVTKKNAMAEAKERGETLIGTKKSGVMCAWYKGVLKIIDLETNIAENYDRKIHGNRGSMLEIREEKSR